jgi:hypothetical protein
MTSLFVPVVCLRASSIAAAILAVAATVAAQAPGDAVTAYDAITDRVARGKGPTPAIGGADSSIVDPAFGHRVMRLTDGLTRPGAPDRSYRTPSGTHSNAWSADGRYFYSVSTDGTVLIFAFDAARMSAARVQPTSTGDGGLTARFFNEPTFSYATPGVLYGTYNGSGANLRSVDQFDIASGQYTQLLNLDTLAPDLAGTYVGGILSSAGPSEKIIAFFGGTSQDRHMYLVAFDQGQPSSRRLLDTLASTVDGQVTNIPLNFRIHAAAIDRSGRYVTVYPTGADLQAPRSAAPAYVWDTAINTFTAAPLVEARSGGHDAYGYGVRVNQDCCTTTTWDAAQWQFRSLAAPLQTTDLVTTVLLPKEVYLADHPSWHNARPDRLTPFVDANYRYGNNTTEWRALDEEIFAVETENPGHGATIWRFAHHRSNVAHDTDPSRISFWYTPRVNVSPDGRWALFTSNWDKTLGIDPRGEAGGAYRQDLFLVELQATASAAPLTVTTTGLPGAEVAQPYSATLSASGGSGNYAWTLAAGQLPAGLGLASTGLISGTPLAAGTSAFTVRVVDVEDPARMAEAALEIVVASPPPPPAPPLAITTTGLPEGRRDQPYSTTLAASGGVAPYVWSIVSGSLPNGLSLNAATGTIAGTPRQHGTFRFTVRLSDTSGATAQAMLQLRISKR